MLHSQSWSNLDGIIDRQESIGRNVVIFGSASKNNSAFGISTASCDSLSSIAGVRRSGLVVPMGFDDVLQLGPHVPVVEVSGSLLSGLNTSEVLVGSSLARGSTLPQSGHVFGVSSTRFGILRASVDAEQPTGIATNGSLALRLPSGVGFAQQCVAQLSRFANPRTMTTLLQAQLVTRGGAPVGIDATNLTYDVVAAFRSRPEQWADTYVGALCGFLCALLCRFLSSEAAAYRLSGTSRTAYLRLLMIEQVILAGAFLTGALVAEAIALGVSGSRLGADIGRELGAALAWIGVFGVAALPFAFIAPTKLAKNR